MTTSSNKDKGVKKKQKKYKYKFRLYNDEFPNEEWYEQELPKEVTVYGKNYEDARDKVFNMLNKRKNAVCFGDIFYSCTDEGFNDYLDTILLEILEISELI